MFEQGETDNLLPPVSLQHGTQKIRWILLFIFVCFSVANSFQSTQYTIIEDIVRQYFSVEEWPVDLTGTIFMLVYVPLIFPAMYFLEDKGLRPSIILGTLGTAVGAWIKVVTVKPNLFWAGFFGQTIVAVSQVFMLSVPPCLAAVWFGPKEVTLACAIGVFGSTLGSALGFYLPPIFCKNHKTLEEIHSGLWLMFVITAVFSTAVFLLAVAFFKDKPSTYQQQDQAREDRGLISLLKRLCNNKNYMLLVIAFTINQGVFNTVTTLLTELILPYFKNGEIFSGDIGLIAVIASMVGSLSMGYLVNKTHKFREVSCGAFALSFVGMVAFSLSLLTHNKLTVNAAASFMGFFLGGYMTIGLDFGVELTYPEPESLTSGFLTAPGQLIGLFFTMICDKVISTWGPLVANICMCVVLCLGAFLHAFVECDLRRQAANDRLRANIQDGVIQNEEAAWSDVQIEEAARSDVQNEEAARPYVQNKEAARPYVQNIEAARPYVQNIEAARPYVQNKEAASSVDIQTEEAGSPDDVQNKEVSRSDIQNEAASGSDLHNEVLRSNVGSNINTVEV